MFENLIEILKANPRKIVYTEGSDARILESAARLKKDGFLTPILVGNVDEVKAAAAKGGFDIEGLEIIDPLTYPEMDAMVEKMVELRRGKVYDAVIMDPPSYGRGPSGEIWKLEDSIDDLILLASRVLSDDPLFFLVNSYTTGLSPSVVSYIMGTIPAFDGGVLEAQELGLPVTETGMSIPCGSSARWSAEL